MSRRYLNADARSVSILQGLGGRHVVSAAIIAKSEVVAIVVYATGRSEYIGGADPQDIATYLSYLK